MKKALLFLSVFLAILNSNAFARVELQEHNSQAVFTDADAAHVYDLFSPLAQQDRFLKFGFSCVSVSNQLQCSASEEGQQYVSRLNDETSAKLFDLLKKTFALGHLQGRLECRKPGNSVVCIMSNVMMNQYP